MNAPVTCDGYHPGHPWYYLRGGKVLSPKQILADVIESGYRGYNSEAIATAGNRPDPKRLADLNKLRDKHLADLKADISRYRQCARDLQKYRLNTGQHTEPVSDNVHVNISLKHNHIVNEFGHLIFIDTLLAKHPKQLDLFG